MLNEVKHLMKKCLFIFILMFMMPVLVSAGTLPEAPDSTKINALGKKLDEYFKAIETESLEVQQMECDFIIGSAQDSALRGTIAEKVYDHYMESARMGAEGVAVYIYEKWFADGRLKMSDEIKQLNARIFADFNRSSLIGCQAPSLRMQTLQGDSLTFTPILDRRYKVLYFYATDCAKCKVQTILLRKFLDQGDYPIDFYAIYVGDNRTEWEKYATAHLNISAPRTKAIHLWDAGMDSDFQRKYGVLQTPRLFLVGPGGQIIGRGLDARALGLMLKDAFSEKELVYGTDVSAQMYDGLFRKIGDNPKAADVKDIADYIASSTLGKADTVMFRQMTGDLLYYLISQFKGPYKEGLHYLIGNYILSKPDVWRTQDDSLKVVGMAQAMDQLLSKTQIGSQIPSVTVPVTIRTHKSEKSKIVSLNKLKKKRNIIMFYLPGCSTCKEEMAAAEQILNTEKSKVALVLINMDEVYNDRELSEKLLDLFDLSIIPNIIITDKSSKIIDRYVSLL